MDGQCLICVCDWRQPKGYPSRYNSDESLHSAFPLHFWCPTPSRFAVTLTLRVR